MYFKTCMFFFNESKVFKGHDKIDQANNATIWAIGTPSYSYSENLCTNIALMNQSTIYRLFRTEIGLCD